MSLNEDQKRDLERALQLIHGLLDNLKEATGLNCFQVLEEGKLPADASLTLMSADIYKLIDMLHEAFVAITNAKGIPPFIVFAEMRYGDPDSLTLTPAGIVLEAEIVTKRAAE